MKNLLIIKTIYVVLLMHIIIGVAISQNRTQLEKKRNQLIADIEKTEQQLLKTKSNKEENIQRLTTLQTLVSNRKALADNLALEIKENERLKNVNVQRIDSLLLKKKSLSTNLHNIIRRNSYSRLNRPVWLYLIGAQNFSDLMIKWRYMKQYESFQSQKNRQLEQLSLDIATLNQSISLANAENISKKEEAEKQLLSMHQDKIEMENILKKLSFEEAKLAKNLKTKHKEREKLNQEIERIIVAELSKSSTTHSTDVIDNNQFSKNKGILSWPIAHGKVTSKFGRQPHPSVKNIDIENNGIDITTTAIQDVKAIFGGDVVGVSNIPGFNFMVIIRHGTYHTVYSKMDNCYVKKGDTVKIGQSIGQVGQNQDGLYELHFEMWKDKTKINPESWLKKM